MSAYTKNIRNAEHTPVVGGRTRQVDLSGSCMEPFISNNRLPEMIIISFDCLLAVDFIDLTLILNICCLDCFRSLSASVFVILFQ